MTRDSGGRALSVAVVFFLVAFIATLAWSCSATPAGECQTLEVCDD